MRKDDPSLNDYFVAAEGVTGMTISAADIVTEIVLQDEDGVIARGKNPEELAANIRAALAEARAEGAREERERMQSVFDALETHHKWHCDIGTVTFPAEEEVPEPVEIDLSAEYGDSTLCQRTVKALALRSQSTGEG